MVLYKRVAVKEFSDLFIFFLFRKHLEYDFFNSLSLKGLMKS